MLVICESKIGEKLIVEAKKISLYKKNILCIVGKNEAIGLCTCESYEIAEDMFNTMIDNVSKCNVAINIAHYLPGGVSEKQGVYPYQYS